jgi:hypothetical protein
MLERIDIENLGSIRRTSLSLSPLTVLLGANASGKTTVMRGLELFAALRHRSLQEVTFAGNPLNGANWPSLVHGGDLERRLALRAFVSADLDEPDYEMELGIDWGRMIISISEQDGKAWAEPEFLHERLRDPGKGWIEAGTEAYSIRGRSISPHRPRSISVANTITQFGSLPHVLRELEGLPEYLESFGDARYFRPNSTAMLHLVPGGKMLSDGSGFVAALAALQNRQSERFSDIEQRLSNIFPHIRRIRFDIGGEGKIHHLLFETHRSRQLVPARLEADGVLTTLFLLWAGTTMPPHGTLLIDDPEAALHPHLMGTRVQFLRSLANGELTGYPLRVVVATQSVDFVRWLEPSELRVVEYSQEAGTLVHAVPASETLRTLVEKFQTHAGDLWYSGAIGGVPGAGV